MPIERVVSLDLLRGIAAFGVAISHFFYIRSESILAEYLSTIFVEIFFPLSGFVLAAQIIKCRDDRRNLKIFFYRRWMRTIPPYLVAIICAGVLYEQLFSSSFFVYLAFLQDAWPEIIANRFYNVAWSLSIEEYFYFLFPIVVLLGSRNHIHTAIYFVIFFQLIRIAVAWFVDPQFLRTGTFLRLDAIAIGFLVYFIAANKRRKKQWWPAILLVTSAGVLLGLYFKIAAGHDSVGMKLVYINAVMLFGVSTLLCFKAMDGAIKNVRWIRCLAIWGGKISYPVYLFHILLAHFFVAANDHGLMHFLGYVAVLIVFTSAFHVLFERPILMRRPPFYSDSREAANVAAARAGASVAAIPER